MQKNNLFFLDSGENRPHSLSMTWFMMWRSVLSFCLSTRHSAAHRLMELHLLCQDDVGFETSSCTVEDIQPKIFEADREDPQLLLVTFTFASVFNNVITTSACGDSVSFTHNYLASSVHLTHALHVCEWVKERKHVFKLVNGGLPPLD